MRVPYVILPLFTLFITRIQLAWLIHGEVHRTDFSQNHQIVDKWHWSTDVANQSKLLVCSINRLVLHLKITLLFSPCGSLAKIFSEFLRHHQSRKRDPLVLPKLEKKDMKSSSKASSEHSFCLLDRLFHPRLLFRVNLYFLPISYTLCCTSYLWNVTTFQIMWT